MSGLTPQDNLFGSSWRLSKLYSPLRRRPTKTTPTYQMKIALIIIATWALSLAVVAWDVRSLRSKEEKASEDVRQSGAIGLPRAKRLEQRKARKRRERRRKKREK